MRAILLATAMLLTAAPVAAKKAPPPPEPAEHPSWADARAKGQAMLVSALFDPGSAQITFTSGFRWGFTKPVIGGRSYGWVACGTVNAKNRMGGYVGATPFWIRVDANGTVTADAQNMSFTSCDEGGAPLQPELQEPYGATPVNAAGGGVSIADELSKLSELKTKGIITQAEFDTQKAKLLAR